MTATDHYTIISSDCHAGGNHAQYREYLDPALRDDFDAWRGGYRNPFRDLQDWLTEVEGFWGDQLGAFKAHAERRARGRKR